MMPTKPLLPLAQAALRDVESGYKQRVRSEANATIKLAEPNLRMAARESPQSTDIG